ncbi:hypothetical protein GWI33_001785 [Rhynchophorus ferrugineus]|uniref:Uncharacterized protein n=1 Tax=Rhynchophorus ferrugineus TaxID=354439 RepID=A0A834MGS2_RHYFE|nr:hypothetical protein GWI33_001785 [Rhynchophorus ferrugineus]
MSILHHHSPSTTNNITNYNSKHPTFSSHHQKQQHRQTTKPTTGTLMRHLRNRRASRRYPYPTTWPSPFSSVRPGKSERVSLAGPGTVSREIAASIS